MVLTHFPTGQYHGDANAKGNVSMYTALTQWEGRRGSGGQGGGAARGGQCSSSEALLCSSAVVVLAVKSSQTQQNLYQTDSTNPMSHLADCSSVAPPTGSARGLAPEAASWNWLRSAPRDLQQVAVWSAAAQSWSGDQAAMRSGSRSSVSHSGFSCRVDGAATSQSAMPSCSFGFHRVWLFHSRSQLA